MKLSSRLTYATVLMASSIALAACAPNSKFPVDEANQETQSPSEAAPAPSDSLPLPSAPKLDGTQASAILAGYQHLDPNHESMSAEILLRVTKMSVQEVKDGDPAKPNCVHVIPPGYRMGI